MPESQLRHFVLHYNDFLFTFVRISLLSIIFCFGLMLLLLYPRPLSFAYLSQSIIWNNTRSNSTSIHSHDQNIVYKIQSNEFDQYVWAPTIIIVRPVTMVDVQYSYLLIANTNSIDRYAWIEKILLAFDFKEFRKLHALIIALIDGSSMMIVMLILNTCVLHPSPFPPPLLSCRSYAWNNYRSNSYAINRIN